MGRPAKTNPADFIGKKFGRFTILEFVRRVNGHNILRCVCDCGNEREVRLSSLTTGNTYSCGCYSTERRSAISIEANTKHGLCYHPLYSVWANMKDRCSNSNNIGYQHYGGRGIRVCTEWETSFEDFYEWATSKGKYSKGLSIERLDVDGNYEPSNCTFANLHTQSRNKRASRVITIDGVTKNWIDWCRFYSIPESTVRNRVNRGMSVKDALTTPRR